MLFVHFWKDTIPSATKQLNHAFEVGMSTGDIEFAMAARMGAIWTQFERRPLSDVENEYQRFRERAMFYRQQTMFETTKPVLQCIHNLLGRGTAGPTLLVGEIMGTDELQELKQTNELLFVFSHCHLMMLSYLFNDIEKATACAKILSPLIRFPPGGIDAALLVFFDGLVAARNAQITGKWKFRRRVSKRLKRLRHWAKYAP